MATCVSCVCVHVRVRVRVVCVWCVCVCVCVFVLVLPDAAGEFLAASRAVIRPAAEADAAFWEICRSRTRRSPPDVIRYSCT